MTNANDLHETKTHGQLSFPYAVYKSDIPRDMRSFPCIGMTMRKLYI